MHQREVSNEKTFYRTGILQGAKMTLHSLDIAVGKLTHIENMAPVDLNRKL